MRTVSIEFNVEGDSYEEICRSVVDKISEFFGVENKEEIDKKFSYEIKASESVNMDSEFYYEAVATVRKRDA